MTRSDRAPWGRRTRCPRRGSLLAALVLLWALPGDAASPLPVKCRRARDACLKSPTGSLIKKCEAVCGDQKAKCARCSTCRDARNACNASPTEQRITACNEACKRGGKKQMAPVCAPCERCRLAGDRCSRESPTKTLAEACSKACKNKKVCGSCEAAKPKKARKRKPRRRKRAAAPKPSAAGRRAASDARPQAEPATPRTKNRELEAKRAKISAPRTKASPNGGDAQARSARPSVRNDRARPEGRSRGSAKAGATPPAIGSRLPVSAIRPALVFVPDGLFQMGSPDKEGDGDEHPRHWVRITRTLWFGETEVTQGQFKKVMGKNPSYHAACGDDCPVERVSWYDAVVYCNKLSIREGLEPCYTLSDSKGDPAGGCADDKKWCHGDHVIEKVQLKSLGCNGYRLPTEAEWEYACRAGRTTRFWSGDTEKDLARVAWYDGNSGGKTHPVGEKREPHHPWGLLNMHGNVWEWCNDGARRSYGPATKKNAVVDPATPPGGAWRVIRGGSFGSVAVRARPALRNWGSPQGRDRNRGFRVVRPVVPEPG